MNGDSADMIIPYQVDVPMSRWSISNFVLIGVISIHSLSVLFGAEIIPIGAMILDGWSLTGILGHVFLHGGLIHLIGNMIFLWVFGNAVCAKIGNTTYPLLFFILGLVAVTSHNLIDGNPAIGASGAINGVVGMYLIYYPRNKISCFYFVFFRGGSFSVSSFWMILLWLAFDIWGASTGGGTVAYWAHLGGFVAGASIGACTLALAWVEMTSTERSLFDILGSRG